MFKSKSKQAVILARLFNPCSVAAAIWRRKCFWIAQIYSEVVFLWGNWRISVFLNWRTESLCLPPCSSYSTLQPCICLSVPQMALEHGYCHFSGAGREQQAVWVHTGRRCKNRQRSSILLGHGLALWQLNPTSFSLSPDRTQKCIHLAKGEGNPCILFLLCFLFWRGQLQFSCRERLFKLGDQ